MAGGTDWSAVKLTEQMSTWRKKAREAVVVKGKNHQQRLSSQIVTHASAAALDAAAPSLT